MSNLFHVQRVRILYKTILRLHRGLPPEIQVLGTNYVRDEFRRHKNCNEDIAIIFMNEWTVSKFYKFNLIFLISLGYVSFLLLHKLINRQYFIFIKILKVFIF